MTERTKTRTLPPDEAHDALSPGSPDPRDRSRIAEAAPWLIALLGSLGGIGALGYIRGRYQHSTTYYPDRLPTGVAEVLDHDLEIEDVWFESTGGLKLHGWWMFQREAAGTILYCHGSSGSIAHRIDVFQGLVRLGMNVFAFDYRGYGKSEGVPGEKGLYDDVRAAYDHLVGPLSQSPARLVLFGHSLGGAVAIDAALDRSAAGLVVEGSFTDIKEMARALYPQIPLHWVARNGFRSIDKVGRIEMPKLFIHGTADPTVPFEIGRRLYQAAAEPKELYLVPDAGHNDVHQHGGEEYLRRIERFLRLCLR
jgi:fermentation-respiration switch protein FrsA (DUF1100 family)